MKDDVILNDVFLRPGEYFVGDATHRIRTVLGSCVSITLWHPFLRIGAMSHFLLSSRESGSGAVLDAKYGEESLSLMCKQLHDHGVRAEDCHGKIFGGGNMFSEKTWPATLNIGQRNGEAARILLRAHGIKIMSESLFGNGHRQILFDVESGDVWVRQVKPVKVLWHELSKCA